MKRIEPIAPALATRARPDEISRTRQRAAPSRRAPVASPSPLNGERAGVRRECVRRGSKVAIISTGALALLLAFLAPARAGVLPPDAAVEGRTIGEWTAEWWKWVFSAPTNQNPHLDSDGRWSGVGQPDTPVFFLGGSAGLSPDPIIRTFTVPAGRHLLVPVLVAQADNIDSIPLSPEELRDLLRAFVDAPRELHAEIDGVPVPNLLQHRAESPVFNFEFTNPDNFKSFAQGHPILGLIDPSLSDGYWLMVEPLPVGSHMLRFGGTWNLPFFFPNEVIANITVAPTPIVERVVDLIALVQSANLPRKHLRRLLATLRGTEKAFVKEHVKAGVRHLRAFQKKVRHELGRRDSALAGQLIQAAQQIIDLAEQNSDRKHKKL